MNKKPFILAVDIATTFGWFDGVVGGSVKMTKDGRYAEFLNFMQPLIKNRGYTHIVYEKVDKTLGNWTLVYCGLRAILIACALNSGCKIAAIPVTEIKLKFTGDGRADKLKMIAEAIRRGHNPEDDNHADAIGLHYVFMENYL